MATQARKGKSWLGSLMRLGLTYLLIRALFSARISLPAAPVKRDPVTGAADLHPPVWPGLWGFLKAVKAEIDRDRVFPVAAGVTFYAILALFPALAAFVTLYGIFADRATVADHLSLLAGLLPPDAVVLISDEVNRLLATDSATLGWASALSIGVAIWGARGGISGLMEAMNIAYGVPERRSFVKRTAIAVGLVIASIATLIALVVLSTALPKILMLIPGAGSVDVILLWLRWPLMVAGLTLALSVLYAFAPDRPNIRFRWISPGAISGAVLLVAGSAAFSWYATNFAGYGQSYGSLGAAVALMMWIWLSSIVVLVGAEINAEMDRYTLPPAPRPLRSLLPV